MVVSFRWPLLALVLALAPAALAEPPEEAEEYDEPEPIRLPPVIVAPTPDQLSKVGGSVHTVGEEVLETFEYDDPNSVLYMIPGVYIRQEDAYGLRPNIGLRGANSDRSKKVTLMEDGVLFAPAPYAAPAAYYFPLMTRIVGVEVYKGPAAIRFGPNTIGGAINLQTRDIPARGHAAFGDVAYGSDNYLKVHGTYGYGDTYWGALVEAVHLMTDGFKELDGGGETGFNKQEVMLKLRANSDPLGNVYHRGDIKLGFSHENSHETYTGLTDADFEANPYRRYRASALDEMNLLRFQIEAGYTLQVGENLDLTVRLYRHDLMRAWQKLNRIRNAPSLSAILANPGIPQNEIFYRNLVGLEDSADNQPLLIGTNDREFISQGIQAEARYAFTTGPVEHELTAGLRYHYDEVERNHTEDPYLMISGNLVRTDEPTNTTTLNEGSAHAVAAHLQYAVSGWGLTLKPGFRVEHVQTTLLDRREATEKENDDTVALFGVGVHYEILEGLGVLAGVHQGFSPVSPGQPQEVESERSINYEAGIRYSRPDWGTLAEAVFFFNDYSNLVGECTFAAGCVEEDLDRQFNAGAVDVLGVEVVLAHTFQLPAALRLPVRGTYTYTHSEFRTGFESENPQFDVVEPGDELPYVPSHQASLRVGIGGEQWGVDLQATYLDAMREVAGQGEPVEGDETDRAVMLDASVHYSPLRWLTLYLKGENLLVQQPIVARRPYGARPGKPLLIMGGIKARL